MKLKRQEIRDMDKCFVAIRKSQEGSWMDIGSISSALDLSEKKAAETDKSIPIWARDNAVIGYAVVHVCIDQILP